MRSGSSISTQGSGRRSRSYARAVVNVDSVGRLPLRIVVPITDWKPHYASLPWFVWLQANTTNGLSKDSGADAFQTKSVSLNRFSRRMGDATPAEVDLVAAAIALCVGYP